MRKAELENTPQAAPKRVYRHEPTSIDDKGRVRLHDEFLQALGGSVVLVMQLTGVIRMYSEAEFDRQDEKLNMTFSEDNESADYYRMAMISNRRDVKVDGSQRISIPSDFRATANIDAPGKCVIIGNGKELLVLSQEAYDTYRKSPNNFKAAERKELEDLREKALAEEERLQRIRSARSS